MAANGVIVRGSAAALGPRATSRPARRSAPTAGTRGGVPGNGGIARPDAFAAGGSPASSGGAGMLFTTEHSCARPAFLPADRRRERDRKSSEPFAFLGWGGKATHPQNGTARRGDAIPRTCGAYVGHGTSTSGSEVAPPVARTRRSSSCPMRSLVEQTSTRRRSANDRQRGARRRRGAWRGATPIGWLIGGLMGKIVQGNAAAVDVERGAIPRPRAEERQHALSRTAPSFPGAVRIEESVEGPIGGSATLLCTIPGVQSDRG